LLKSTFEGEASLSGGTWWSDGWRLKLCRCSECLEMYEKLGVLFLIDPEDALGAYEAKGKENGGGCMESIGDNILRSAMAGLDHVQQIEVVHVINEFKEDLGTFLASFAASGRVITSDDVNNFFTEIRAKKRRRLDNVYAPDNCR